MILTMIGIVVAVVWVIWFVVFRRPSNTVWLRCLRCEECGVIYPQHGMSPSVYNCEKCGNKTTYAMYKYRNKELIVKDK